MRPRYPRTGHGVVPLPARHARFALPDGTLLLFRCNIPARVQEAVDLRAGNLDLGQEPVVCLHGKEEKWWTRSR